MKIVVFDLDETLGYFTEFGIFWDCLSYYLKSNNKKKLTQTDFNNILDLFPEFLRPNILNILNYLKHKKQNKNCHKMMIYTNNQGPKEWAHHIISYFEHKINFKIVDQLIAAFKVNGKIVEICRTSHDKSHKDFIKCTKLPSNAEICFLDDSFYPEMSNDNIYYINVKPYYYDIKFEHMIDKFLDNNASKNIIQEKEKEKDNDEFKSFMMETYNKYNYEFLEKDMKEYEVDKIIGKQIVVHLQEFFNTPCKYSKNKTRKNKNGKNRNKTRRNY